MTEYNHLIRDYLGINNMVRHTGFHALSEDDCRIFLRQLVPFECPDMYAVLDDKIIILEHFEFDASRSTRKGMKGKAEEAGLEKRIDESVLDSEIYIESVDRVISFQNWQTNFESCFQRHYNRISDYKKRIREKTGDNEKPIMVGFWVEDQFPPYVRIHNRIKDLPYCRTVQFAEIICNSPNVDFVLFSGYLGGKPQIHYLDSAGLEQISDTLIDLQNENVTLSHINKNEVVMYGGFQIDEDDVDNT